MVDDASDQPVADLVDATAGGDPRVSLLELPDNRGPAGARNAALDCAQGEMVAFLDDDDLWEPDKVAQQVAHLEADPSVGVVTCDHWITPEHRPHRALRFRGRRTTRPPSCSGSTSSAASRA